MLDYSDGHRQQNTGSISHHRQVGGGERGPFRRRALRPRRWPARSRPSGRRRRRGRVERGCCWRGDIGGARGASAAEGGMESTGMVSERKFTPQVEQVGQREDQPLGQQAEPESRAARHEAEVRVDRHRADEVQSDAPAAVEACMKTERINAEQRAGRQVCSKSCGVPGRWRARWRRVGGGDLGAGKRCRVRMC